MTSDGLSIPRNCVFWYSVAWLAATLLLFLPLLKITLLDFLGNSDALFYSNILALETEAIKAGDWFTRWFADANAGFGSPVMMFYAPLGYAITALIDLPFQWLHLSAEMPLLIGLYASQVASGYCSFLWLRRSFSDSVAFIGSLLFVLLPYKLIYIYLHINLAQLWALAFLPLWMIAAEKMTEGNRRAIAGYALAFGAVYYTHPLTLIAFAVVPAAYALCFGMQPLRRRFWLLAAAHALGISLCCAQALPGHMDMGWIHAERFFGGAYSWRNNFFHKDVVLCSYYGIIAFMVGVAMMRIPALQRSPYRPRVFFWLGVLASVTFLTQRPSDFLYEIFTPLQYLQFPAARLHAVALLAAVYCICVWLTHHREMMQLGRLLYHPGMLAALIVFFTFLTGMRVYTVETDPSLSSQDYMQKGREARLITTPVPIYESQWGCIDAAKAFKLYVSGSVPQAMTVVAGKAGLSNLDWRPPGHISFSAHVVSDTAQFDLRQCYIPLWRARVGADPLALEPALTSGVVTMILPKGDHVVDVALGVTDMERFSRALSCFGLLICALICGFCERRRAA